jgi:hypothetical protein
MQDLRANLTADTDLFFPRHPSAAESGAKRGVVVVAQRGLADLIAKDVSSLDRVEWRQAMLLDEVVTQTTSAERRVAELENAAELQRARVAELENAAELQRARVAELENAAELQRARVAELENAVELQRARVAELQLSRWRKLGLLLGLAKRASFEH